MNETTAPSALADKPIPSSAKLAGGVVVTVQLKDGRTVEVFVRMLPARHLEFFIDQRDAARESVLLEFVVQRNDAAEGAPPLWKSPDWKKEHEVAGQAAFIDLLEDESHAQLLEVADWLNLKRAVLQAERKIAMGNSLLPMRRRMAEATLKPVDEMLQSLKSSLVTALSNIAPPSKG